VDTNIKWPRGGSKIRTVAGVKSSDSHAIGSPPRWRADVLFFDTYRSGL
jgi:hypothetical protein